MKEVLNREIPLIPRINFGAVDVRDVALAQMHAMTLPQAAGIWLNNLTFEHYLLYVGLNIVLGFSNTHLPLFILSLVRVFTEKMVFRMGVEEILRLRNTIAFTIAC